MIRKLKKIIGYYLHKEKKSFLPFEIAGVNLKGIKGTYRKKVDQDDAWFFALAQNSEQLYDLGCNIGYMSLLAAIQKNNKGIVLVDPNPEALAKAAQNLIINGFGLKSKFVSAFVGDLDGEKIKFYTVGSGEAGSMYDGHAETAKALNSYYEVEKISIDSLVKQFNCVPDLIKIDVEGAEYLALQGAVATAARRTSKFFIEMHSPPELPMLKNATLVLKWCLENRYKAYYLKEGTELTDAVMIAKRGKCHLLLLPEEESYPSYLKGIKQSDPLPISIN